MQVIINISIKGFRRAEEYSEMFKVLKEEGIIGKGFATKLEDMARFRELSPQVWRG